VYDNSEVLARLNRLKLSLKPTLTHCTFVQRTMLSVVKSEEADGRCDYDQRENNIHDLPQAAPQASINSVLGNLTTVSKSGAYCRVLTLCLSVCLTYSAYFAIASLLTSFNKELGYVTYFLLWVPYFPAQFFASPIAGKVIKPNYSLAIAFTVYVCYYATNIYPTWYSLPISATMFSVCSGTFFWVGSLSYLTNLAYSLSNTTGRSYSYYIISFQGAFYFVHTLSSAIGSAISFAFLLPDQLSIDKSNVAINLTLSNITGSNISSGQCQHDIGVASVSEWAYYGLNSVLTSLGIVAVVLVMLLPPRPRECSISCLSLFSGYENTFLNGTFTKFTLLGWISFYREQFIRICILFQNVSEWPL
jgi:predicted membrane protein